MNHFGYNEEYGFPEGSEIYRKSLIGLSLYESLAECLPDDENAIHAGLQALRSFDQAMLHSNLHSLRNKLYARGTLTRSRCLEGVWCVELTNVSINEVPTNTKFKSPSMTLWFANREATIAFSGSGVDPLAALMAEKASLPFWAANTGVE